MLKRTRSISAPSKQPFKRPRTQPKAGFSASYLTPRRPSPVEKKFFDSTDTNDVTTAGNITPINLVRLGNDDNNRIGRKIVVTSIQVRARFGLEAAANASAVRCALIYDKQTNGALPALSDIYDTGSAASAEQSMHNLNNRDRFVVLYDEIFQLDQAQKITHSFKYYRKVQLETVYGADGATIAEISTGALYWVTIGSFAAGATDVDQFTTIRIRYLDS